jgi:hypothetical protein
MFLNLPSLCSSGSVPAAAQHALAACEQEWPLGHSDRLSLLDQACLRRLE